jgi:hypothetical protein
VQEVWVNGKNKNPVVVGQESNMIVIDHKQSIVGEREASHRTDHGIGRTGGLGAEKGLADYGARGLAGKKIGCGAGH